MKHRPGFTLMEVILAMTVLSITLGMIYYGLKDRL